MSTVRLMDLLVLCLLLSKVSKFFPPARMWWVSLPGLTAQSSKPARVRAVVSAVMYALVVAAVSFLTLMHQVAKPL